ncbi:MAG: YidC/Oxa1 family insertase periplasmic-domain containing protein [Thermoguttaceae bacterium]
MPKASAQAIWVRYFLFVVLSLAYLVVVVPRLLPPPPKPEGDKEHPRQAVAEAAKGQQEAQGGPGPAKPEAEIAGRPPEAALAGPKRSPRPPDPAAKAKQPDAFLTLGSVDPASPYRMLVTLTNRGAAINRIEMSSPRFHDLEDRSGYLGHLVVEQGAEGTGCVVQVVGAGTPAAQAEPALLPGDRIVSIEDRELTGFESLQRELKRTRPGQRVTLAVRRKDAAEPIPVSVRLGRRPLEVIRPERGAPASFLVTLAEIDGMTLQPAEHADQVQQEGEASAVLPELEGVDLRTANWEVVSHDQSHARFRRVLPRWDLEVEKTFALQEVPPESARDANYKAYHLSFELKIRNLAKTPRKLAYQIEGPNGLPDEGWWYAGKVGRGWGAVGLRDVAVCFNGKDLKTFSPAAIVEKNPGVLRRSDPISFIGVDAQYFAAVLIPDRAEEVWFSQWEVLHYWPKEPGSPKPDPLNRANTSFRVNSVVHQLEPQGELVERFVIFAGPKRPELLAAYGLQDVVYYGWYGWVAKPLLWILHTFYALIPNYAVAIILLTVVVRGCMFPLSRKQAQSAQKMQELQPELRRIYEKYKNNLEARNKAQQELFRKHNFNPMGGCLILFLQLPIFVGLYRALMVDVELRQAPLISEKIRWASNLSAPDMLFDWSWLMPEFVTKGTGLLGLGPYFNLLPVLTVWLFLWQQKKFTPPPTDERAAMNLRIMRIMMIFMGILFFKVASGLCIYFIASSLWSVAERKFLPKATAAGPVADRAPKPAPATPPGRDGTGRRRKRSRRK